MKVAIDGRRLQDAPLGGVGRYFARLVPRLATEVDLVVLTDARRPPPPLGPWGTGRGSTRTRFRRGAPSRASLPRPLLARPLGVVSPLAAPSAAALRSPRRRRGFGRGAPPMGSASSSSAASLPLRR